MRINLCYSNIAISNHLMHDFILFSFPNVIVFKCTYLIHASVTNLTIRIIGITQPRRQLPTKSPLCKLRYLSTKSETTACEGQEGVACNPWLVSFLRSWYIRVLAYGAHVFTSQ